jgi:group I intron endonuclease
MQKRICGIYKIVSITNPQKFYVGSTIDFYNRKRRHISCLQKGKHHSPILQNHANKYGVNDFDYYMIEVFDFISKEHLIGREQYYIDTLLPCLNAKKIADSCVGLKRSEEAKVNIGLASKGHIMPEHVKQLLISINTGSHHTKEAKEKIRKGHLGKKKPYMTERNKGNTFGRGNKGKPSPFKGKKKKPTGVVPRSAFKKGQEPWNKGKKTGKQDPSITAKRVATMKRKREEREK